MASTFHIRTVGDVWTNSPRLARRAEHLGRRQSADILVWGDCGTSLRGRGTGGDLLRSV